MQWPKEKVDRTLNGKLKNTQQQPSLKSGFNTNK